jgi:hypothetical protein
MVDWHVFLFDDDSSPKSKKESLLLQNKYGRRLTIIFSPRHVGITKGLNRLVGELPAGIAIPISADLRFCSSWLPWRMIYAFLIFKVDFFFYKARHVDLSTGVRVGTTGWARTRGLQVGNQKKADFATGKTRPSGYAVAFRADRLKQYRYDPRLGPMCDTYLNNLMVMRYRSYYWGRVGSETLERPGSFSRGLDKTEHGEILSRILAKLETDGIRLNEEQRSQFLKSERSAFPG